MEEYFHCNYSDVRSLMNEDEFTEEKIAELVGNGFFEVSLDPDTEEPVFRLSENAQEIDPEVYRIWLLALEEDMLALVEAGLVEMKIDDEGVPTYSLTRAGELYAEGLSS